VRQDAGMQARVQVKAGGLVRTLRYEQQEQSLVGIGVISLLVLCS
jgi:hypothetical protein